LGARLRPVDRVSIPGGYISMKLIFSVLGVVLLAAGVFTGRR
jgi:hypothetical protein